MTRSVWVLVLAAVLAAGIGGYWTGHHGFKLPQLLPSERATEMEAQGPSGPVIYYRDPDGKPFYSPEPKQTADGRNYRAVLASEDVSFDFQTKREGDSAPKDRSIAKRILYYRNPMGLPDVSPIPKKDSMGMDYIPVYEGEDDDGSSIKISPGRLQRIGVKSEAAKNASLHSRCGLRGLSSLTSAASR